MNLQPIISQSEKDLDMLVRDFTEQGFMAKSEARERFIKMITQTYLSTLTLVEEELPEEKEAAKRFNTFKEGHKAGWNSYRTQAKANITKLREGITE